MLSVHNNHVADIILEKNPFAIATKKIEYLEKIEQEICSSTP